MKSNGLDVIYQQTKQANQGRKIMTNNDIKELPNFIDTNDIKRLTDFLDEYHMNYIHRAITGEWVKDV